MSTVATIHTATLTFPEAPAPPSITEQMNALLAEVDEDVIGQDRSGYPYYPPSDVEMLVRRIAAGEPIESYGNRHRWKAQEGEYDAPEDRQALDEERAAGGY